jgi:hypothetical protein
MLVGPKSQGGCTLAAGFNRAKSRLLSSEVDSEADRHIGFRLNSLIAFIIAPESHSLGAEDFSFPDNFMSHMRHRIVQRDSRERAPPS